MYSNIWDGTVMNDVWLVTSQLNMSKASSTWLSPKRLLADVLLCIVTCLQLIMKIQPGLESLEWLKASVLMARGRADSIISITVIL